MSTPSRSAQYAKVLKVLKRHYKPVASNPDRPVMEHLLLACCLENAHYDRAEESLATLVHTFFDWNEIRVTTVKELSEVLAGLPDPTAAATRIKKALQHVFEASYCFDLEELRKKTIGQAVERLEKSRAVSKFACAYVVQAALDGHAIPIDAGTLAVLRLLDLVTDKDVQSQSVPGLERAVAKNKGVEFAALLHQLGADYTANPYSPSLHKILLQINPDITSQLPKRRPKPAAAPAAEEPRPAAVAAAVVAPAADPKALKGKEKAKGKLEVPPAPKTPPAVEEKKKPQAEAPAVAPKAAPPAAAAKAPLATLPVKAASGKPAPPPAAKPTPPLKPPPVAKPAPAVKPAAPETPELEKKPDTAKKKPPILRKVSDDDESAKRSSTVGLSKKKPR